MRRALNVIVTAGLLGSGACSGGGDIDDIGFKVTGFEVRDIEIPGTLHLEGLTVPAKLFVPILEEGARPLPAVVVLHGSGGLFAMPDDTSVGRPCSPNLEPQFARWGERLARLGYIAIMPASHDARGFCDYYDDRDRIPDDFDDPQERLLGRLYDTDAASRHLCAMPEVDCDRIGLLGFSHGASTVMLALHWQLRRALGELGEDLDLDLPVMPLPPGAPNFQVGIAYYPGCGLESVIHMGSDPDADDPMDMYFPDADLHVEHGSKDDLINDCSVEFGKGRRQLQSATVARVDGLPDPYHIRVHHDARHGFDNAGSEGTDEGSGSNRPADIHARDTALTATLEHLSDYLGGARR